MIVEGSRAEQHIERGIRAIINGILRLTMIVAPLIVTVGWVLDQPLILKFDEFEATTLLLSIVVMTYLISDGRSNYFEGLMLIGT
jgi:Ca2+:H+ antiporter